MSQGSKQTKSVSSSTESNRRQTPTAPLNDLRRLHVSDVVQEIAGRITEEGVMQLVNHLALAMTYPKIGPDDEVFMRAIAGIAEKKPKSSTEGALAAQMIATNGMGLMYMMRATLDNQRPDGIDANVNRASRLMRIFTEQFEAMQKLKGMWATSDGEEAYLSEAAAMKITGKQVEAG